jgi:predicted MFS family arabinose efflux permease
MTTVRFAGLGHALGLAAGPLVAMGMARFAYALLLPPMRTDLQWTYTEAGAMNTANAVGYLAGAIGRPGSSATCGCACCS